MAGKVGLANDRRALVLEWTPSDVGGPDDLIKLETANLADLSVTSGRDALKNDGFCTVTVGKDDHGSFEATFTGPDGSVSGDVDY